MKDKPTASEEWTGQSVRKLFDYAYTNEIMDSCNYIAEVHKAAIAFEQEKAAAWVVELADRYEKKLDAERQKVQTLTDELNRIREVATKTDWNLALRIATVLEKVGKPKVSKKYQNLVTQCRF